MQILLLVLVTTLLCKNRDMYAPYAEERLMNCAFR